MSLSIITPHFNNSEGIKNLYDILCNQTVNTWEWIIVDDKSDKNHVNTIETFFKEFEDTRVVFFRDSKKTNASVCRNKGLTRSRHDRVVFLDSDDGISKDFVENRSVKTLSFIVYKNMMVVDHKGNSIPTTPPKSNYLNHFFNANFIWQTTAIVWNKRFLIELGAFNPKLERLQDVELSIRALFNTDDYVVLDNSIDFYYNVQSIRERKKFVQPVCESVDYLVINVLDNYQLSRDQKNYVKAFYYMCVKYLERSGDISNTKYVKSTLKIFYDKNYFSFLDYIKGLSLLKLYKSGLLTDAFFLRCNRFYFKTKVL
ncbi:glycosyltransferase family 2 protein [Winogradskyella immobilis]|uniref:Glycosyltransferase n=1 Tax=Winogradskyella immobilis TaxID=2816852 RepID=A0ABS8ENW4_9FLAO|nr:glycosyltransferase [Winogradskyella immobilis]MCC1484894.1 glycosyltransferase [Winogradskyella immobilis]MCG0016986.1 glycosyltransferase [Winogradskyella immobilis]